MKTEWRTMDSAPKDGTRILVTGGENEMAVAWICELTDGSRRWCVGEIAKADGTITLVEREDVLTHWMPPPAPPEEAS